MLRCPPASLIACGLVLHAYLPQFQLRRCFPSRPVHGRLASTGTFLGDAGGAS